MTHRMAPVALTGLVAAALLALAGTRSWEGATTTTLPGSAPAAADASSAPAATALALALLACWGVLLVTRGGVRRALAWLALLLALGALAATVVAILGKNVGRSGSDGLGWVVLAAVCALLGAVASGLAARHVRDWPEMSARYDRPDVPPEDPASARGVWRALDEGRDPTA